jgi:hypothetical protein
VSAYIEVRIKGDRRAFIEAGSIAGIVTSDTGRVDTVATAEKPIALILRGGETLEVYGESPAVILARCTRIRAFVKHFGLPLRADLLDRTDTALENFEMPT